MQWPVSIYRKQCTRCPRLAGHLAGVREAYPRYFAAPVPPFGATRPRLLVVGLAPGMHGANATGRPFTGDLAGVLLYQALHRHGLASAPASTGQGDGLRLHGCRITNAVKCLPPGNRPTTAEIGNCNDFLRAEMGQAAGALAVVLALGRVAHQAVLKALDVRPGAAPFGHGRVHRLQGLHLVDSYHCSGYNTRTGRLTPRMFEAVFRKIDGLLDKTGRPA